MPKCGMPGYTSQGNLLFKGCTSVFKWVPTCFEAETLYFSRMPVRKKPCQTANLHHLSIFLSFMLLLWEISGRAPAGVQDIGEALIFATLQQWEQAYWTSVFGADSVIFKWSYTLWLELQVMAI